MYTSEKAENKKGTVLTPIKVYPYLSVKKTLEDFLSRPGFLEKCEKWRNREHASDMSEYLCDVYDGEVWKRFNSDQLNNSTHPFVEYER